jgi:hypothetical protein
MLSRQGVCINHKILLATVHFCGIQGTCGDLFRSCVTHRFECAVGDICHPQHTQTSSNSSMIVADSSNGVTNTRCCRYSCMHS